MQQIGCNIDERNVESESQKFGRHTFMKHGVDIMLNKNKKWQQQIIDTEYSCDRSHRQSWRTTNASKSGYADHHVEKCTDIEKHTTNDRQCIPIIWEGLHC